ncbi:MAG: LytTR family DNA-binding domain-containing protein [Saprospiraceae bacterium]|nr:LytTR family DNA-binding domain-containing protein [Saprospiraceae bacterium]
MSFRCIIIDDEELGRNILRGYLEDLPEWDLVAEFENCLSVENFTRENQVDLILLDIEMPKISGIEFLSAQKDPPLTIFVTAYPQHAVKAFELEAFDYLVKPVPFARFRRSLQRVERHLAEIGTRSEWITIKEGKRLYKLDANEAASIQAYGDYVRIYTSEKTYITKSRLADFCKDLPRSFLQVHRSWYINLEHVEYLEGNAVQVGSNSIPVSSRYKESLLDRINA